MIHENQDEEQDEDEDDDDNGESGALKALALINQEGSESDDSLEESASLLDEE